MVGEDGDSYIASSTISRTVSSIGVSGIRWSC